jgi:hypothetical protein
MKPTVSAAARDARGSPAPAISHRTPTDPDTSGADFMSPGSSATAAYLSSASLLPDKASTRHHTGIFLVLVSANTTPTHLTELARGKAAVVSELSTGPLLREIARSMGRKRFTAGTVTMIWLLGVSFRWETLLVLFCAFILLSRVRGGQLATFCVFVHGYTTVHDARVPWHV